MPSENSIIQYLTRRYNSRGLPELLGDDAALLPSKGNPCVITLDTLVEGVHFHKNENSKDLGRKLAAVTLSDIAAMAAKPRQLLISLALPRHLPMDWIKGLYDGMNGLLSLYKTPVTGGDTVRSPRIVLTSVGIGEALQKKPVYRKGAKPGDSLYATGYFGFSLETRHHLLFTPRLREVEWLLKYVPLHALTDASDGLSRSLELLTLEQNLGADVFTEKIAVRGNRKISDRTISHALFDGEDFELVFASPEISQKILKDFERKFKIPLLQVGSVKRKKEMTYYFDQKKINPCGKPFEHF